MHGEISIDDVAINEDYPPSEEVLADAMSLLEKMREDGRETQPPSAAPVDVEKIRRRRELIDTISDRLAERFDIADELAELRKLNREMATDFTDRENTESPPEG